MANSVEICCICGQTMLLNESHNAEPVVEKGRCCEACNKKVVLPYRFGLLMNNVNRA